MVPRGSSASGCFRSQLSSERSRDKSFLPLAALVTSQTGNVVSISPLAREDKVGVLLLNLGGPETLEDVQPFLFNLFADPVSIIFFMVICVRISYYTFPLDYSRM